MAGECGRGRLASRAALALVAATLAGCTHNYLYNAQRDRQAQAAVQAAAELKLAGAIREVDKRFQGLLELELEAAATRFDLIRELEIREVAFSDKPIGQTWLRRIDGRLKEILGRPGFSEEIGDAENRVLVAERKLLDPRDAFSEDTGQAAPNCATVAHKESIPESLLKRTREENKASARRTYEQLRRACGEYLSAKAAYDQAIGQVLDRAPASLLGKAMGQLKEDEAGREAYREERRLAAEKLRAAVAEYDAAAQRSAGESDGSYAVRVTEAAKKLQQGLARLDQAQGRAGKAVLSEEFLQRANQVLGAVAGGAADTSRWEPELRTSVAVLGTLPALTDEARRNLAETARPRMVPYALVREQLRLAVEAAAKVDEVLARRIEASARIVDAYKREVATLARVKQGLEAGTEGRGWQDKSLPALNASLPARDRRVLYELLGVYFDDVPRYQRDEHLWQYRRLATFYDESMLYSSYSAQMWEQLIVGVSNTLSDYHGSGVKPEHVAEFLKAAGLIYIGAGVSE